MKSNRNGRSAILRTRNFRVKLFHFKGFAPLNMRPQVSLADLAVSHPSHYTIKRVNSREKTMDSIDIEEVKKLFFRTDRPRTTRCTQIEVTKFGVPMAMIVPVHVSKHENIAHVIEEMKEFRRGKTLGGILHREMIDEGRP